MNLQENFSNVEKRMWVWQANKLSNAVVLSVKACQFKTEKVATQDYAMQEVKS